MSRLTAAWLLAPILTASGCSTEVPTRFVSRPAMEVASLSDDAVPAPPVEFAVTARGVPSDGVYPLMALAVDGTEMGRALVDTDTARYVFQIDPAGLPADGPVRVEVRYLNDTGSGPTHEDRNLFVESLAVNGKAIPSYTPGVLYSRVAGVRDTIPGQVGMYWGGELIFILPAQAFALPSPEIPAA